MGRRQRQKLRETERHRGTGTETCYRDSDVIVITLQTDRQTRRRQFAPAVSDLHAAVKIAAVAAAAAAAATAFSKENNDTNTFRLSTACLRREN